MLIKKQKVQHKIVSSKPVSKIINWSKKVYIRGVEDFSLYIVANAFWSQLRRGSIMERASAISFNIVMAMPPTLIFIFTLIPYLPISDRFLYELYSLIRDVVPGEKNHTVIIDFLSDFLERPRNELLSFGLFLALFFSSNAMMGILRSFDKNYEGFKKRTGLEKRRTALLLTLVMFVLVFIFILLLMAQGAVLEFFGIENNLLQIVIANVRWIIIIALVFFNVSFLYRHGPSAEKKWPYITPGSVFATTLTIIASLLFSFWVTNFSNYNKVYGSISAIFVLMLLFYVNALVILMGFELNVTIGALRRKHLKFQKEKIKHPLKS